MGDLVLRWLKLSLVALVACGFIGMIIYALWMRDEIRSAQVEPPLIPAAENPAKRRPDDAGGMVVPNRDKLIFDLLDEASTGVSAPAPAPVAGQVAELPLAGAATPTEVVAPLAVAEPAPLPKPKPEPEPKPRPVPVAAKPTTSGGWGVQVAAVGSHAAAQKLASTLQARHAALQGLTVVTPATGTGQWRVQFGGAASRAAAAKVCEALKGKQACFPVTIK